jgi:hypothetical protein
MDQSEECENERQALEYKLLWIRGRIAILDELAQDHWNALSNYIARQDAELDRAIAQDRFAVAKSNSRSEKDRQRHWDVAKNARQKRKALSTISL